jgi:hypothetical protein
MVSEALTAILLLKRSAREKTANNKEGPFIIIIVALRSWNKDN